MALRPLVSACAKHLAATLQARRKSQILGDTAHHIANSIDTARFKHHQIPLWSTQLKDFDETLAYKVSAAYAALGLRDRNNRPVGRKIGFTNENIWKEYNVDGPIWGYLWDKHTFHDFTPRAMFTKSSMLLQPKIEPEIIFSLLKRPHSSMSETEALSCVEWIAHGFEMVDSLYKDWKFTAADAIAMNSLHRSLHIGKKHYLKGKDLDLLRAQLQSFTIKLYCNDRLVDTGVGQNVLGSPVKALLHLCRVLENQDIHPLLTAGEIITTGTLTRAHDIAFDNRWHTELEGIDLRPMNMRIGQMNTNNIGTRMRSVQINPSSRETHT